MRMHACIYILIFSCLSTIIHQFQLDSIRCFTTCYVRHWTLRQVSSNIVARSPLGDTPSSLWHVPSFGRYYATDGLQLLRRHVCHCTAANSGR